MIRYIFAFLLCLLCACSQRGLAQEKQLLDMPLFADSIGSKARYAATIEMGKGYVSGVFVLAVDDDGKGYKGVLFNEFGITAMELTYGGPGTKVKLLHVIKMLDKWYIKRVLRKDMAQVIDNILNGVSTYRDEKYHITYKFVKLDDCDDSQLQENKIIEDNDGTEE